MPVEVTVEEGVADALASAQVPLPLLAGRVSSLFPRFSHDALSLRDRKSSEPLRESAAEVLLRRSALVTAHAALRRRGFLGEKYAARLGDATARRRVPESGLEGPPSAWN